MSGLKIAVLISGGGSNLQALIDKIKVGELTAEIALIISNREKAFGLTRGKEAGIRSIVIDKKAYSEEKEATAELIHQLKQAEIDLVVLAGYLDVVPAELVQLYRHRIINIHPSLIPSFAGKGYYGRRVHEAVYSSGVKLSGATVHFVNEEVDGGPIILQEAIRLDFEDTPESIQEKVLRLEHKLLPLAVKLFAEARLRVANNRVEILGEV